jgi:hypothetical protein
MARRIEVELTSSRDDGTWTWRAAGARQPKGELDGSLLYPGVKEGDVVKVEAEFHLDGIEITTVFPPKQDKPRTDLLELKGRPVRDEELVTARLSRREGARREGDDRRRGSRDEGPTGERRPRSAQDRPRPTRPEPEPRPRPKRLRPRRAHRDAVLAEVPEEYRPIAERVLSGGIPEVRKALEEQNAAAKQQGQPELASEPVLAIAEGLLPRLREAEWRDRADAALAELDELDLRDLRSVVVAADAAARDDASRALAAQLREGLSRRVDADHAEWLAELTAAVDEGRVVRALRLSSRPVKAGSPLAPELATRLAAAASAALAGDISQDRWATVLDAVAFSPVRGAVTPAGVPQEPGPELLEAVKRVADRVPSIAAALGVDPAEAAATRNRARRARPRRPGGDRTAPAGRPPPAAGPRRPRSGPAAEQAPSPSPAEQTERASADQAGPGPAEATTTEAATAEPPAEQTERAPAEATTTEAATAEPPAEQTERAPADQAGPGPTEAAVAEAPAEQARPDSPARPEPPGGADPARPGEDPAG